MIDHRRNNCSFTSPIHRPTDNPDNSNELEFLTWAEGIKGRYSSIAKSGAWSRRTPRSYSNHGDGEDEFKWLVKPDNDSDIPSPPLWEKPDSPTTPQSPTSRAQMIAGYRQELMGLVSNAPESAYELTLKDIVELPTMGDAAPLKGTESSSKRGKTRRVSRNELRMETGGLLLKMFLPFSLGRKKKVSPKPTKGGAERSRTDEELRKKSEFGERGSSSSSSGSTNGGNSIKVGNRSRSRSRKIDGCSCFRSHKSRASGRLC